MYSRTETTTKKEIAQKLKTTAKLPLMLERSSAAVIHHMTCLTVMRFVSPDFNLQNKDGVSSQLPDQAPRN